MKPSVRVVRATGRPAKDQTTGMLLEEAFAGAGVWIGQLRTEPGSVGGWHHHGDHDTFTYLAQGNARFEWGPSARENVELKPGDFVHIPPRQVHRETNSGSTPNLLIVFRKGTGPTLVPSAPP